VGFAAAVGCLAALTWLAWTLLHYPKIPNPHTISMHDTVGVLQLVFATVAGAGALVSGAPECRRAGRVETPYLVGPLALLRLDSM